MDTDGATFIDTLFTASSEMHIRVKTSNVILDHINRYARDIHKCKVETTNWESYDIVRQLHSIVRTIGYLLNVKIVFVLFQLISTDILPKRF